MAHKIITPPIVEPIALDEAKSHLRLGSAPHPDDADIGDMIAAARDAAEQHTGQSFATQTWESAFDGFPAAGIELEGSVVSIVSVSYIDADLVTRTLDPARYQLDSYARPNRLRPAPGAAWPSAYAATNAVKVRYGVAGTPSPAVRQAMLLLVSNWYENREAVAAGLAFDELPLGVHWLLAPFRVTMGV